MSYIYSFAHSFLKHKDQSLVEQMYMTFFFYQLNFQQFQAILGSNLGWC